MSRHCEGTEPLTAIEEQTLREAREIRDETNRLRAELSWALSVIEHEVEPPESCGACGTPNANCDGACADAAYWSQHMRAIRVLVGAP